MRGTQTGGSACITGEHQMTDHMDGTEHPKAKKPAPKRSARLAIIGGTDTQTQTPQAAVSTAKKSVRSATNKLTGLTDKQEAFVQAYLSGENASDAYRQAYDAEGMKPATVWECACRLLSHPKVVARIMAINEEREEHRRMQQVSRAEFVLQKLTSIASSAENSGTTVRALELLGKHVGLFTDKVEVSTTEDRTADQIERDIAERLRRLGLAK
jgi:phage terminase small subunit